MEDIIDGLKENNRATAIMACGTGKTLVTLWAAERMDCKRVLVLVPSLALLDQTLKEWLRHTSWDKPAFISVCSDPTVEKGADELVIREADLKFKVDTDPKQVRRFLQTEYEGVKLVFCTYQSSLIVGKAITGEKPFDLGIFDEAHKTAGREGINYSFALDDKRLPIQKRLFVTATPRLYDIRKRDKEGDAKLVRSMDILESYGPRVHTLTFGDAAHQGIICDYKVIISVITSEMVNGELLRRGEVIIEGDSIRARQVANQIALKKAIRETGSTKVITFHSRVKSAASFTGEGGEGISSHLEGFATYHVNGKMPASDRKKFLDAFKEYQKAIMSNARCLTEGIDVPEIDMVAFLSPRRSRIDIVQAVGRALRKHEEGSKTFGYVLVPLFLEQEKGETIEEAVERGYYEEVWDVLNAMKEQDNELTEIIAQMREERGRTKGFDDSQFRGKVVCLGPEISLDILRKSITARCIENLGDNWDERYGELKAFKEKHGHCVVPQKWPENQKLGNWVSVQRYGYNRKNLNQDRIKRLNELGFEWDPIKAYWEEMFAALVDYHQKTGNCNVPAKWPENPIFGSWVTVLRQRKNRLTQDQIKRLNELGFEWDPINTKWEEMFQALVKYKKKFGDCNVPHGWPEIPQLSGWMRRQRQRKDQISQNRFERLNKLGIIWDPLEALWEEMYQALVEYKKKFGNCNVRRGWPENKKLATWVGKQRDRKDRLSQDRIKRLNELGYVWDPLEALWEEMFEALVEYKKRTGNCNVPRGWPEKPRLGEWVNNQRHRKDRLTQDQIKRLNELGFVWEPREALWEEMFEALVEYKKRTGNCNAPKNWPEKPQLGSWVFRQRYEKDRLPQDRVKRLNALGFVWEPHEALWEEMYQALVEYNKIFGNCNVRRGWPENKKLATWVLSQRQKKDRLSQDRIKLLNELGFVWEPHEALWAEMFEALFKYKNRTGDCDVPAIWPEKPQLGLWVANQRRRKDRLTQDRIKRLNELGFNWGKKTDNSSSRP